jgi:(p)ppGpp synthase/HD superfamily hydrolase
MKLAPVLTDRFREAFAFASEVHAAQKRKGTSIPYISHLMGVASLALDYCDDEDTAIAALLHDAAEDQGGRAMLEQIRSRFGERVAGIVESCTDTFETPKPDYVPRKQAYLDHLGAAELPACLVAAADKLHNARAILNDLRMTGPELWSRFNAEPKTLYWYYNGVATVLATRLDGQPGAALVNELERVIATIWDEEGLPRESFK